MLSKQAGELTVVSLIKSLKGFWEISAMKVGVNMRKNQNKQLWSTCFLWMISFVATSTYIYYSWNPVFLFLSNGYHQTEVTGYLAGNRLGGPKCKRISEGTRFSRFDCTDTSVSEYSSDGICTICPCYGQGITRANCVGWLLRQACLSSLFW